MGLIFIQLKDPKTKLTKPQMKKQQEKWNLDEKKQKTKHTLMSWDMLLNSALAFLVSQKLPTLTLPTLVKAFSILLSSSHPQKKKPSSSSSSTNRGV